MRCEKMHVVANMMGNGIHNVCTVVQCVCLVGSDDIAQAAGEIFPQQTKKQVDQ